MASVGAVPYIGGIVRRFLTPIHRVFSAAFQPAVPLCFFPSFFEPFFDRRSRSSSQPGCWLMAGWQAVEGAGRLTVMHNDARQLGARRAVTRRSRCGFKATAYAAERPVAPKSRP